MAESDLSISQLPPLTLPVQGSDLLHISRGGDDFRISRAELVKMLISQLGDANISGTASGQALVYNSAMGKWTNQFISWASITGKPSTFTPIAHTHIWDEITDAPTELPPSAHTHPWSDLTGVPSEFPPEAHVHPWSEITFKPATFPPDPHDHSSLYYTKTELNTSSADGQVHWDNITNKPETFGTGDMSKSVYDLDDDGIVESADFALTAGSVDWDNITNKPTVFGIGDMTKAVYDLDEDGIVDAAAAAPWSGITGKPATFPPDAHTHDDNYFTETELSQSGAGGSVHWDNIAGKPATFSGDMAKAVYDQDGDDVVDIAASVPWSGITGKPATFPPDVHNHDDLYSLLGHDHDGSYAALGHTHANYLTDAPLDGKVYGRKDGLWAEAGGLSSGDMAKATYDTNEDGVVDAAESVPWSGITSKPTAFPPSTHSHDHAALTNAGAYTHLSIDQHIQAPAPHSLHSVVGHTHTSRQVLVHHINSATVASGATVYVVLSIAGYTSMNGIVWPVAGYFKNLMVRTNSAQPASGSLVFTLQKGLVDTSVVATVPAGSGASMQWNSGANSQYFVAGELLSIKVKNNATAASCAITTVSWEFQPDTI